MTTYAAVAFIEKTDSFTAGQTLAEQALAQLAVIPPQLALVFSTSAHDPHLLAAGLRQVLGDSVPLIGGYAVGIISTEGLGYDGHQAGLLLLGSDSVQFSLFQTHQLPHREYACGTELGQQLAQLDSNNLSGLLLLYDSVNRADGQFNLNMAVPLLQGISEYLPETTLKKLIGAGLVGDMACRETFQWFNQHINQGTAMALAIQGDLHMYSTVLHGCRPSGDYFTITAAEGPAVLEIEGIPALDFISNLLGKDKYTSWREYAFFVTLGVNQGDKYATFAEENYQNRLCLRADPKRNALIMFEPDLVAGTQVQLMRRSIGFSYIGERVEQLLANIPAHQQPCFALYIDCAGRAARYCGAEQEEAVEVLRAIGCEIPLLGWYSGVEIGQVAGQPQSLDWTGVLTVFCQTSS